MKQKQNFIRRIVLPNNVMGLPPDAYQGASTYHAERRKASSSTDLLIVAAETSGESKIKKNELPIKCFVFQRNKHLYSVQQH